MIYHYNISAVYDTTMKHVIYTFLDKLPTVMDKIKCLETKFKKTTLVPKTR